MSDQAAVSSDGAAYLDVEVSLGDLDGPDGNAFVIMGRVREAIALVHGPNKAAAWWSFAIENTSYDTLLAYVRRTVTVVD